MTEILDLLKQNKTLAEIFANKSQQEIERLIAENDYETARVLAKNNDFENLKQMFSVMQDVDVDDYFYHPTFAAAGVNKFAMACANDCEILWRAFFRENFEMIENLAKSVNGFKIIFSSRNSDKITFLTGKLSAYDKECHDCFFSNVDIVGFFREMTQKAGYIAIQEFLKNEVFVARIKGLSDEEKAELSVYILSLRRFSQDKNFSDFYFKMLNIIPNQLYKVSVNRGAIKDIFMHEYGEEHLSSLPRPIWGEVKGDEAFCVEIMLRTYDRVKNVAGVPKTWARGVAQEVFDYVRSNIGKMKSLHEIATRIFVKHDLPEVVLSKVLDFTPELRLPNFRFSPAMIGPEVAAKLLPEVNQVLRDNGFTDNGTIEKAYETAVKMLWARRQKELDDRANIDFYAPKPEVKSRENVGLLDKNQLFL